MAAVNLTSWLAAVEIVKTHWKCKKKKKKKKNDSFEYTERKKITNIQKLPNRPGELLEVYSFHANIHSDAVNVKVGFLSSFITKKTPGGALKKKR